jgi:hypothetical protein
MYFFNFLDRNAIANGKLNGLVEDLNLKGTQFNTCVSILFVGYLCGQIPSNMILSRVRPSIYMSDKKFPHLSSWISSNRCTKDLWLLGRLSHYSVTRPTISKLCLFAAFYLESSKLQ